MTSVTAIDAQPKSKDWHSQSAEDVLTQLGSSSAGLSTQDAAQRLEADGANEIKEGKRISPVQICSKQLPVRMRRIDETF